MKKVFLLAKSVSPVRLPIYNIINDAVDFTIGYTGTIPDNIKIKTQKMKEVSFSRFSFTKPLLYNFLRNFDIAILPMNFSMIDIDFLIRFYHPCKLITWGIGVPASYTVRYDDLNVKNFVPFFCKYSDAVIYYTQYPKNKYIKMGYDPQKMFVANNTVGVERILLDKKRDSILFVGTLYPAKRLDLLIDAYKIIKNENISLIPLHIIGKGSEEEKLRRMTNDYGLSDVIHFHGAIYSDKLLTPFFERAYALISPDQAGLSVLKSMGLGVPFITTKNAYTGGERLNISHNINGILMENIDELTNILRDIHMRPSYYEELGKNAYKYYWENCRPDQMAQGFLKAINYVSR